MATIRVQKNKEFVVMSNRHLRERQMSLKAKGLLSLMLSLPEDWDYSIAGLCVICKESQTAIRSTLKELEDFRYLHRERLQNDKGHFIYEYTVYELPYDGNEYADKKQADKGYADNRLQQSIKKKDINNKSINKENIYNINDYLDILNTVPDSQLRNLLVDFLENRNNMNAPLSKKGFELLIERVRELGGLDIYKQIELVKTAVINNWKNVYPKEEEPKIENEDLKDLEKFYRQ